jgi:signal transduction histidine kinase
MWHRATARGAFGGVVAGFVVWAYTLLIPSFVDSGWIANDILKEGLFGISALKPRQLLGLEFEPLTHGVIWSLTCNIAAYIGFSMMRLPTRIEDLQASIFTAQDLQGSTNPGFRLWRSSVTTGQLEETVARYLGRERARAAFADLAGSRDMDDDPKIEADIVSLSHGEHLVASAVGPASARLVMALLLERHSQGSRKAMQLLDDASTAIQASRKLLQSAIDNMPQGIAVFSERGELIIWNPNFQEVLHLPSTLCQVATPMADIIRSVSARTYLTLDAAALQERLDAFHKARDIFRERFIDTHKVVDMQSAALPDGGIVLTITDVTQSVEAADALQLANETLEQRVRERTAELTKLNAELVRAKAQAETANLSKTRFIAAASHDILQPLNAARLFTSSLVESADRRQNNQLIHNVDQSLEAVEDILSTILDISRFDAGAVKPDLGLFHVQDVLTPLGQEFAPLAAQKNLRLRILPSKLIVKSDRKLLRRILQNLISNAIKYTSKGGVLVGCRTVGNTLQIKVYDTGFGIPEGQQRTIFQEFERLGQDKGAAPGLGLGLSIVERMCGVLRHPVTLTSVVDQGTVFSVTVPLGQGDVVVLKSEKGLVPTATALHGLKVLAVDNEVAIVEGLRALLSGWGVEVTTATTADEVLKTNRNFDVVLADYHINQDDGIKLVTQLRKQLHVHIPAILITADRSVRVQNLAAENGLVLLRKPVKPAALRAALSQVMLRKAGE